MRPPLHSLVQFGYLEFIADPLFHGLKWLHKYVPKLRLGHRGAHARHQHGALPLRISSYKTTLENASALLRKSSRSRSAIRSTR